MSFFSPGAVAGRLLLMYMWSLPSNNRPWEKQHPLLAMPCKLVLSATVQVVLSLLGIAGLWVKFIPVVMEALGGLTEDLCCALHIKIMHFAHDNMLNLPKHNVFCSWKHVLRMKMCGFWPLKLVLCLPMKILYFAHENVRIVCSRPPYVASWCFDQHKYSNCNRYMFKHFWTNLCNH